ncbi:serine hydrolase domain-containing protein [Winogradskyella aurantiaca]|uniref:serine hydrolase domain-containing protein n=1 Tax=Winogradskyella aurantiaca TaxID=2219558 RepID=UPI000E1D5DC8|nr:serine hydrolase [Winogradskyella aurantiaca]
MPRFDLFKGLRLIVVFFISTTGNAQDRYFDAPKAENDGWEIADVRSMDLDTTRLYHFFSQAKAGPNKLHSALLVKEGTLVIEEYFNGQQASEPHDMRSVSKSIRSLLLGIAIDKGYIDSIDDPISDYLGPLQARKNLDPRKKEITIRHLITMSTGWDCNDWDQSSKGQEDRVYKKSNWLQYTLDLPMINDPGTVSNYCSMGVILMSEIISQASGMSIDTFAQKYLFNPLGINNVQWGHTNDKPVIDSGKRLYMTSRDLAKIGLLVLQNGQWDGQQIVSREWIEASTSSKTKITNMNYGFLWWQIPFKHGDALYSSVVATGNGGQYIMIIPKLELVAVFTGNAYNSQEDKLPFAIVKDVFIPTFME